MQRTGEGLPNVSGTAGNKLQHRKVLLVLSAQYVENLWLILSS